MSDNTAVYERNGRKEGRHFRRSWELPVIAAMAAGMMALSILLLLAMAMGVDIRDWGSTVVIGAFLLMSVMIWGLLVLVNR